MYYCLMISRQPGPSGPVLGVLAVVLTTNPWPSYTLLPVELILPGASPPASFPADARRTTFPVQAFPQLGECG